MLYFASNIIPFYENIQTLLVRCKWITQSRFVIHKRVIFYFFFNDLNQWHCFFIYYFALSRLVKLGMLTLHHHVKQWSKEEVTIGGSQDLHMGILVTIIIRFWYASNHKVVTYNVTLGFQLHKVDWKWVG